MDQTQTKVNAVEKALDKDLEPIPDYGDLFSLADFIERCKHGSFIDYDGSGYYVIDGMMSRSHRATPSEIRGGKIEKGWTHVMWFNR